MLYYYFLAFLIMGSFLVTRLNTVYHQNLLLNRYIIVKNPKVQFLFISKTNPEDFRTNTPKDDQNKLLYLGIVFYILWVLLTILSLIMWFIVPKIPTGPFLLDDYLGEYYISTLNQILPFKLWITYGLFDISFWALNIVKCSHDVSKKKVTKIVWIVTIIILFAASFASIGYIFTH